MFGVGVVYAFLLLAAAVALLPVVFWQGLRGFDSIAMGRNSAAKWGSVVPVLSALSLVVFGFVVLGIARWGLNPGIVAAPTLGLLFGASSLGRFLGRRVTADTTAQALRPGAGLLRITAVVGLSLVIGLVGWLVGAPERQTTDLLADALLRLHVPLEELDRRVFTSPAREASPRASCDRQWSSAFVSTPPGLTEADSPEDLALSYADDGWDVDLFEEVGEQVRSQVVSAVAPDRQKVVVARLSSGGVSVWGALTREPVCAFGGIESLPNMFVLNDGDEPVTSFSPDSNRSG